MCFYCARVGDFMEKKLKEEEAWIGQGEWDFGVLILMGRFNAREWREPLGKE